MNYFGTKIDDYGHFFFVIDGEYIEKSKVWFRDIPFDPEELAVHGDGNVSWHKIEGYSICAITGSCVDKRTGGKSVFWLKEDLTKEELKEKILSHAYAKRMIEKMPFIVKW